MVVGDLCDLQGEAHQLLFRPWVAQHGELHFCPVEGSVCVSLLCRGCAAELQSTTECASGLGARALFLEAGWPAV